MSDNPYIPPHVAETPQLAIAESEIVYASQNKRLLNLVLDTVFFYLATFVCGVGLGLSALLGFLDEQTVDRIANFAAYPIYFAYFIFLEFSFGRSVGKLITGTRVIREDGRRPSLGQILGRTASRLIPFEPFSFLFGNTTTGWHDSISGTRVIDVRRMASSVREVISPLA